MKVKRIISVILIETMMLSIFVVPAAATETTSEVIVHYYNENNWQNPYIYYYYDGQTNPEWPGSAMTSDGDGWYSYTISNYSTARVIFSNNGADQYPAKNQEGLLVSGEKWFKSGAFYNQNPDSSKITVHYYNSNAWNNPYIYYYTDTQMPITWPGVAMTSDGNGWYSYDIYGFEEAKVIFSNNGSEQNPEQNQIGYTVTGEKWFVNNTWYDAEPDGITVHYYDYNNWGNVNIYYYNGNLEGNDWTGVPMYADGNGWYTYKIYGFDEARVLFNNGAGSQIPGVMEEGFLVSDEMWYRNGAWTIERPDEITVYFYKPENWSAPNIYYYLNDFDTGPAWPGTAMTSVGDNWYTYTITKYSASKILFNDGNNQIPAQNQAGFDVTGIMWYKDGVMCNCETDTDEDELPDYMEMIFGTNLNKADSDSDGLPDGFELFSLGTDPLKVDSDSNVINDGQEDFDSDGLTNLQEYNLGTDTGCVDSDSDGLTDSEEVNNYKTNPLKEDTDEDLMSDYTEVQLGLDPLKKDTDNDGVIDSEEILTTNVDIDKNNSFDINTAKVVPSVSITGCGDYNLELSAEDIGNNQAITDIPCIVGSPYEFIHDEDLTFDSCTLTFTLSDEVLSQNSIVDLMIVWYDESNNTLNPIQTSYNEEKKQIFAEVEHFSIYAVMNKKTYYSSFASSLSSTNSVPNGLSTYNGHYYAVINESMSWTDAMEYCTSLGGHLVTIQDKAEQDFVTSLVKKNPKKNTYWIGLTGENNHYSWVTGEPLKYKNWADGEPNNSSETAVHLYANVVAEKYVGLWNDTFNKYDGDDVYYSYKNCGIICEWNSDPREEADGCFIKLSNGLFVKLDKDPSLGDRTIDTDGDGLCDLDELNTVINIHIFNPYAGFGTERYKTISVWSFTSNPAKADTDGDGINDNIDIFPLHFNDEKGLIFQTENFIGLNKDTDLLCSDLEKNDYSYEMLVNINSSFEAEANSTAEELEVSFYLMGIMLTCLGNGRDLFDEQFDKFKNGTDETIEIHTVSGTKTVACYSSENLTSALKNDSKTQDYIEFYLNNIHEQIKKSNGDISNLGKKMNKIINHSKYNRLKFHWKESNYLTNGMTLCLDNIYGFNIVLKDYHIENGNYSGTLHFKFYDNFGLDLGDVSDQGYSLGALYGRIPGFRAWFTLQHYEKFDNGYEPFINIMEFDIPFSGNINK